MFSKHKRKNHISSINNYNKYSSTIGLDERGLQDSLKAAQVIFQRHTTTNTTNKNTETKESNNIYSNNSSLTSLSSTISHSREDNTIINNIKRHPRNQQISKSNPVLKHTVTSPSNTTTQIRRKQQNSSGEDISRPSSRRKNDHHSNNHKDITKLPRPSPLPILSKSNRSSSPSNGSANSSSGNLSAYESLTDNIDYADLLPQSPIDHYIDDVRKHSGSSLDVSKHIGSGNNALKGDNLQINKTNNLNDRFAFSDNLIQQPIPSQKKLLKDKKTQSNIPRRQLSGTMINEINDIQSNNINQQEHTNIHHVYPLDKHYRIPPPILVNSKDLDSTNFHNQISSPSNKQSSTSNINNVFMSSLESVSGDNSYISLQDEGSIDYTNEENKYINKNIRNYKSPELCSRKSSSNSSSDLNKTPSYQGKNYYGSEDEDESESEADKNNFENDDIFTLGTVDPDNISEGFFSDDDDILYNNNTQNSPEPKKGKGKKVRRIGKMLKVTGKKVYPSELKTNKDKTPSNVPIRLKATMRHDTSKSFNEDKPWKKHKDAQYIEENDRKRYEGVWVRNRFAYLNLLPWWPQDTYDGLDCNVDNNSKIDNNEKDVDEKCTLQRSTLNDSNDTGPLVDLPEDGLILNLVVKAIWQRSNLPNETLFQIYNLVDTRRDGTLDRRSFIVGMWLVDQCLYGRKLPDEVPSIVWDSVDSYTMNLIQVRMAHESRQKQKRSKRKLMKRELRHIKQGMKHVHL